MRAGRDLLTA